MESEGLPPPPPMEELAAGTYVAVAGHLLFITCAGEGSPVVVLDAGAGNDSTSWSEVQPKVARFTRVCSYDRAGLGRSDPGVVPDTSANMVAELRTLLRTARVAAPYVLVGHSAGGMNMQLYGRLHPKEVLGLVLVDAAHEEGYLDEEQPTCPTGVCRGVDYRTSAEQVKSAPPLKDIPLRVLMHGRRPENFSEFQVKAWPAWQRDLARRSPRGELVVAKKAGHDIQLDQPELVVSTIREVVELSR